MKFVLSLLLSAVTGIIPLQPLPPVDVEVRHLTIEDGLSSSQINSIYADEFGILWIATEHGLNYYDGFTVDNYPLPVHSIREVIGDKNGHIWFRSIDALWEVDLATAGYSVAGVEHPVSAIWSDNLYWATSTQVYEKDSAFPIFTLEEGGKASIVSIAVPSKGILYVALDSGDVFKVECGEKTGCYHCADVFSINADVDQSIWINSRSEGTMHILPDGTVEHYRPGDYGSPDANNIRSVIRKTEDEYYVGTYGGLYILNKRADAFYRYNYSLQLPGFNNQSVRAMYADAGTLYIGTFHAGIHLLDSSSNLFASSPQYGFGGGNLPSPIVSTMLEDKDGNIWVGTVSGGLNVIDGRHPLSASFKNKIRNNPHFENIKSLYYDGEDVWVGSFSDGIYRISVSTSAIERVRTPLYIENVTQIERLNKRHLLAGCLGGLVLIDTEKMSVSAFLKPPIPWMENLDFCVDDSGIWVINNHSAFLFPSSDNMEVYTQYDLPEAEKVGKETRLTSVYKTKTGDLYFCSDDGLFTLDREHHSLIRAAAFNSNLRVTVNRIAEGPSTEPLYLATNRGVATLNRQNEEISYFGKAEGFPFSFTDNIFVSRDSVVYISGLDGVKTAKEREFRPKVLDYKLYIKDIYVGGERLSPSPDGPLSVSPTYAKELVLDGPINSFSVDIFNSIRNASLASAFEYCLEGFETSFQQARSRTITYTNIKPGKYNLIIKGLIPDITRTFPQQSLALTVKPPFYQANWFILLVVLVGSFLLFSIIFAYARSARLRMLLEVEKQDKIRRQQVSDSKTAFMTNVSHEFRTPLTLISSNLESLMESDNLKPEEQRLAVNAFRNTGILNSMVDEFIDYNKMTPENYSSHLKPVDMNVFLSAVHSLFEDYAKKRKVIFTWSPSEEKVICDIDERWMWRAIVNIVSNAFKYTRDSIDLQLTHTKTQAVITVRDNGVGIRKENLGHIFERFYREKEANQLKNSSGSGIGLSFAKRIIEMHSGNISVSSTEGVETTFLVSLRTTDKEPSSSIEFPGKNIGIPTELESPEIELKLEDNSGSTTKMLIVEDNTEMRAVLCDIFNGSYRILLAEDGEEGLRIAEKKQPDIIISDIMMPKMSGLKMCEILKTSLTTSHIPVILLTALDSEKDMIKGLANGADDYIAKPFRSAILKAKVKTILKNRQSIYQNFAIPSNNSGPQSANTSIDAKILKNAVALVEENILNPSFNIEVFAQGLGLSRSLLFSKIKALTGLTPNAFITSIKLKNAAAKIIASPDENTSQIAYECGFETPSYFIKCFRRFYGMTPFQYRTRHKKEGEGQA